MACIKSHARIVRFNRVASLRYSGSVRGLVRLSERCSVNKICHARNAFFRPEARKNFRRGLEKRRARDYADDPARRFLDRFSIAIRSR